MNNTLKKICIQHNLWFHIIIITTNKFSKNLFVCVWGVWFGVYTLMRYTHKKNIYVYWKITKSLNFIWIFFFYMANIPKEEYTQTYSLCTQHMYANFFFLLFMWDFHPCVLCIVYCTYTTRYIRSKNNKLIQHEYNIMLI